MNARGYRKLYGNRTAWDINRHHVRDVKARMLKYFRYYIFNYIDYTIDNNKTK